MKNYLKKHHRTFGAVGALIAFVIGVIYLAVVPEVPAGASLLHQIILVYGHSMCWFLLSGASIIWLVKGSNKFSVFLAYAALAVYVIFMSALLV